MPLFRLFLVSLCFVFAATAVAADRLVIEAQKNGPSWNHDHPLYVNIASYNDTVLIKNFPGVSPYLTGFRAKQDVLTSVFNITSTSSNIVAPLINREWIGYASVSEVKLFKSDNNGVSATSFSISGSFIKYAWLLSDNTVVTLDTSQELVNTYLFNSGNNTWSLAQQIPVPQPTAQYHNYGAWADDHFLVIANESSSADVYERVSGLWERTSTLQANVAIKSLPAVYANGVDTVILAYPFDQLNSQTPQNRGFIVLFTNVGGQWQQQMITSGDLGYTSDNGIELGLSFAVVAANTLLFGAPAEGYTAPKRNIFDPPGVEGKVVMLQRTDNTWNAVADIVRVDTAAPSYFGVGLAVTTQHIVIVQCSALGNSNYGPCSFYTVSPCPFSPIDVMCSTYELNGCDLIDDPSIPLNAFTLNNPQCGDVSVSVTNSAKLDNHTLEVTLLFSRTGVSNTTCTSTVTCTPSSPNSPCVTPNSPSSSPTSISVTTPNTPLALPSAPSKHVSSSSIVIASNLLFAILAISV